MSDTAQSETAIRADYPEPLWIQAVNLVRGQIDSGVLKPGSRLPPERVLCQQLGVSRVTLRRALGQLVDENVLSAVHGRGWYVPQPASARKDWPNTLESFSETAARMGLPAGSRVLRAEQVPATLDQAEELRVAPGSPVFRLDRVRTLGGVAIAVDSTVVASERVPGVAERDFTDASLFAFLTDAGVEPVRADSTIEARAATDEVAELLSLEPGRPVLVMHEVSVDKADSPLFASTITYAGDRYRLRTSFARR